MTAFHETKMALCLLAVASAYTTHNDLWAKLGSASSRTEAERSLDALKDADAIRLWRSAELQPRYLVSLDQLRSVTQLSGDVADAFGVYGSQQTEKIAAFIACFGLSAALSAVGAGEALTFLPEIVRFSIVQALCFSPFLALAAGIALPEAFQTRLTEVYASLSPAYRSRLARHEAGHVLVGHLLGLPLASVSANPAAAAAQFYDLRTEQRQVLGATSGRPRLASASQVDEFAVVSLAGLMAEVSEFGQAEGGAADLGQLQEFYDALRVEKSDQLSRTRWAAVQAFLLLQKHALALETLVAALSSDTDLDVAKAIAAIEESRTVELEELRRRNRVDPSPLERFLSVRGSRQRNDEETDPIFTWSPDDVPTLAFGVTACFLFWAVNGGITLH